LNYKNCKLYVLQSWSSSPHLCYNTLAYVTDAFSSMFYKMADLCLPYVYRWAVALNFYFDKHSWCSIKWATIIMAQPRPGSILDKWSGLLRKIYNLCY
jgi:hypothetical protein